ncbi:hypothetical protein ElyMa_002375800 [Elysia marginata]|uniref:Uncharacterized protein n=1 Tax=Elysia marginata TaxID=1093978 RepID=A0AAV4GB88_9GAST|nr:hypothetical protein ElyMa_002375800 [Elysia marginata]
MASVSCLREAACFIMDKPILSDTRNPVKGFEICKACELTTGEGGIIGAQKMLGLWRVYPSSAERRQQSNGYDYEGGARDVHAELM